jgi:cytochrome b561
LGLKNTTTEWGSLSKALHWLIAIGLFALIYLGLEQAGMGPGDEKSNMRFIHASTATVVLILMTIRVVWRFVNDTPAHPDNTTPIQRQLLGGAMMSGTAGGGLPLFGLASIPLPVSKDEAGHEFWEEFHEAAWIPVAVLIGVHILGSLYNHFGLKNDVLRRMTHGVK